MKRGKEGLLLTVHGAMEFTWRYAWAGFVTFAVLRRPFPLFEALGVFAFAAILTGLSRGRGWRILYLLALQVIGVAIATGIMIHAFYYQAFPFWGQGWVREFFSSQRDPMEWIMLFLFFFWILLFWAGGVSLTRKPLHYYKICGRFDLGFAAFVVLYLIEWLSLARGGIQTPDPLAGLLIFPYFLFSIFAVGLARNRDNEQREYPAGYRGVGLISTVLTVLAFIATALFMLMLSTFTAVAEMGYVVIKEAAEPLGTVLIRVLRFLFMARNTASCCGGPSGTGSDSQPPSVTPGESSWWGEILEELVTWGFIGFLGGTLLALTVFGGWVLVRWLLSRSAHTEQDTQPGSLLFLWSEIIRAFLNYCRAILRGRGERRRRATRLYAGLLAWGRRSGVPRVQSETPGEFGARLKGQFPALEKEIEFIVELYHGEVYGEKAVTEAQWTVARSVWRQLRSPLNWPPRLRAWFFRPGFTKGPGQEHHSFPRTDNV